MSNHEANPGNSNSSAPEQIPHSGVHGFEKPVREFDNTSLGEAKEKGFLEVPETPEALHPKIDKKKMSRGKKIGIALAGGLLAGSSVPVYFATQLSAEGPTGPDTQPSASGPVTPGATEAPSNQGNEVESDVPGFYGEVPSGLETPIILTPEQIKSLNSGVWETQGKVMDEVLLPKIQAAYDALLKNNGNAEGLNLSNIFGDKKSVEQAEEVIKPFVEDLVNDPEPIVEFCKTQGNEDGSSGFCTPFQQSLVELNENIRWDIMHITSQKTEGETTSINTNMEPHIVNGNQLIITM